MNVKRKMVDACILALTPLDHLNVLAMLVLNSRQISLAVKVSYEKHKLGYLLLCPKSIISGFSMLCLAQDMLVYRFNM